MAKDDNAARDTAAREGAGARDGAAREGAAREGAAEPAVVFQDVDFFYTAHDPEPGVQPEVELEAAADVTQVFAGLNLELPAGVVSLVGQNGSGKSTLLLLAGARLFPAAGEVRLFGESTRRFARAHDDYELEQRRNEVVSFVYQNMEFETEDSIGDLMEFVYDNGFHRDKKPQFLRELQATLELEPVLAKRTQQLSKGELQRAIVAFSLLYGSRIIMLDEPVFALEDHQKHRVFEMLSDFAARTGTSVYYSVHELELTRRYSQYTALFYGSGAAAAAGDGGAGTVRVGPTAELTAKEQIEEAFQVPIDLLHKKEGLYRETLLKLSRQKP